MIHKFPFESVISLAIIWKVNLKLISLQILLPLVVFQTVQVLCREENLVKVVDLIFLAEVKLFFFHKKETEYSFELSISICVFY